MKPSVPWVWAPHQSSGTGGTTWAASSFLTSRLPTCGPLPWVMTSSWPAATRPALRHRIATPTASIWAAGVALPSGAVIALPPRASRTRTSATSSPRSGRALVPGLDPRSRARHGRCQDLPNAAMPFGNCGPGVLAKSGALRQSGAYAVLTPRGGPEPRSAPDFASQRWPVGRSGPVCSIRPVQLVEPGAARCRCARRAAAGGGARCAHRRTRCRRTGSAARGSRWCRAAGGRRR